MHAVVANINQLDDFSEIN